MTIEDREKTLGALEASGLRGRGGAWFAAYRKWRAVLAEDGVALVVANGGEGEPGSIKDRFVMRTRPHDVLLGLRLAADTLGAERGYVYLKGSFHEEERRLQAAIEEMRLGDRITVHLGDDTYVGGEETALLESIEGRVAWPRPKPPRPTAVGLFGRPTLVQNVDTLSRLPRAIRDGKSFADDETMAVTLWGDVRSPGVYEIRLGRTFRSLIDVEGGGATKPSFMVFPNGAQSLPLASSQLDLPIEPMSLAAVGIHLGTAAILVVDAATPKHQILDSIARFFEREACGQCPPCTLGTSNLRRLVTGDRPPTIRLTPQTAMRETASFMSIHGYCGHSRSGATSVTQLFARWENEILDHLRSESRMPESFTRDPFAQDSPERTALEAFLGRI